MSKSHADHMAKQCLIYGRSINQITKALTSITSLCFNPFRVSVKLPGQKVISVSLPQTLLDDIDARATSLGLSRSAYLSLLAQQDLTKPGPIPLPKVTAPGAAQPAKPLDLTAMAYDFLLLAIPALEKYEASQVTDDEETPATSAQGGAGESAIPAKLDETAGPAMNKLWRFFIHEKDEILRHKYLRSTELGYNIGLPRAIREWLQEHRALWVAARKD
jgi:hypothetical protein